VKNVSFSLFKQKCEIQFRNILHMWPEAGMPDDFFSDQKSHFGYILEERRMENIVTYMFWSLVIVYYHWVFLWAFCNFYGHLVYFSALWYILPRKLWQPWPEERR
jgi:hypothetical protein